MNPNDMYCGADFIDGNDRIIQEYEKHIEGYRSVVDAQNIRIRELEQWVNDLQSGMYINCVYCGHRYGPKEDAPVSMADVLKEHIEQCHEHPMYKLKVENESLKEEVKNLKFQNKQMVYSWEG